MRIISLRCDGLISAVKQGLIEWITSKDADIICLQDVRVREYKVMGDSRFCPEGFDAFYFEGEDEEQGGVAIFTRHTPKAVMRGLGSYDLDRDGRYIQADFEHVSVVSLLPPSPTADPKELRATFLESLETWMRKIRKKRRHFIFCGDFGVAARTLDLEEWHQHNESPGFTKKIGIGSTHFSMISAMSMHSAKSLPMNQHTVGFRGLRCSTCQILVHGEQTFS